MKFGDKWGHLPGGLEGEEWGVLIAHASVLGHGQADILDWLKPVCHDFRGVHFNVVAVE